MRSVYNVEGGARQKSLRTTGLDQCHRQVEIRYAIVNFHLGHLISMMSEQSSSRR